MATLAVNGGGGAAAATHTQAYLEGRAVKETRVLISELCRHFYTLGWVSGTGGSITIKVHDDSIPKPQQLILMSPSGLYSLPFTHSFHTLLLVLLSGYIFIWCINFVFLELGWWKFVFWFTLASQSFFFFLINFSWSSLYFWFTLYCLAMFIWLFVCYYVFLVFIWAIWLVSWVFLLSHFTCACFIPRYLIFFVFPFLDLIPG